MRRLTTHRFAIDDRKTGPRGAPEDIQYSVSDYGEWGGSAFLRLR